ncbi:MAG TPA: carbohydrate ABC transporter permease [Chloroflexota bacterium]|jgi:multiple sugar transport system permease protein|nr:carbohydrate ABC transporter permease [Chloroflexota bacterium]
MAERAVHDRNFGVATRSGAADRAGLLSRYGRQTLLHVVLLFFSVVAVAPFVWMIFGSLKTYRELVSSPYVLPEVWTLDNYSEIINRVYFLTALRNSFVVAAVQTLVVLTTSALCGFVFAKYRFSGKEVLFAVLLSTMMVPFAVVLVPLYIFISDIGINDSLLAIIVPGLWSTFGIFLMRQFMETIPSELLDAARIDGSSEWRIIGQIVLPLAGAPLGALAVLVFLGSWDNFLWPSIVLNSPDQQTVPVVLAGLRSLYWTRWELWMAGSMLTVVPVMAVYLVASKQFIRGIAMTGIKG